MILTFGLLSPDKGIEYVIDALPAILARHPGHRLHRARRDPSARQGAARRDLPAHARGPRASGSASTRSVIFHNRFVSQAELTEFLAAADIYITPYLNPEQITSGTLAYAVGVGQGGDLDAVPVRARAARRRPRHPRAVAGPGGDRARGHRPARRRREARSRCGERAAALRPRHALAGGRAPLRRELRARARRARRSGCATVVPGARRSRSGPPELPEVNLEHLRLMTDDTGMLQHADVQRAALRGRLLPRRQRARAAADDAARGRGHRRPAGRARARVALPRLREPRVQPPSADASGTSCRTRGTGIEERGSEDSHGRALWALGTVVGRSARSGPAEPRRRSSSTPRCRRCSTFTSPRAWAFALLGIDEYLRAFQGDSSVQAVRQTLAERLLDLFRRTSSARLAVVRGPRHVLQRALAAGADRVRRADGRRGDDRRRPALARVAGRRSSASRGRLLRARSARTASTSRGGRRRRSISSRSRRARWSRPVSTRTA